MDEKDWFLELKQLGEELFGYKNMCFEPWEDYFKEGYTPKDALMEDISNG